jgi:hypothetical protein
MSDYTKVNVNLSNETDNDAIVKTDTVIEKLTENHTVFTNPIVALDEMKTGRDDFETKLIKAQNGGVDETLAKNIAREIVNSNYRINGNFVNSICDGNKTKALLSGYELAKPRTIVIPDDFELVNRSTEGTILVYCRQKPKGFIVKMLQYTYTPSDDSSWKSGGVTRKIKKVIKGLTSGSRVWVRLAVVTDEDIIAYCDPISIIVT